MFQDLSNKLARVFKDLRGHGKVRENHIKSAMRDVRRALLEADVNYKVVKELVARIGERALGRKVLDSLTPDQQIIKIVHEELIHILGENPVPFKLSGSPAGVMIVGLQGSGKSSFAKYLGFIPVFAGPPSGLSYFGAGTILAIMITPIISSLCREVFATVPTADRHAAYALGATRWEMIRQAVLPRSRAGIIGAVMLGLGRALGETIAVALLIGSRVSIDASIVRPGYSMAAVIANQFQEATDDHIRALVGIGVVLFGITIVINMAARALVLRFSRV